MRIDPRLDDFLEAQGLGRHRPETAKELNGRNANFLVVTTTDTPVFVKRIATGSRDAAERHAACVAFEELRREDPAIQRTLGTAPLLASDADLGFLAYVALPGSTSLAELGRQPKDDADADEGDAGTRDPEDFAEDLGRLLAAVHALDPAGVPPRAEAPRLPPIQPLDHLTWESYQNLTAPCLRIWNRLQNDPDAAGTLRALRADEAYAVEQHPVAIHGDVRLDQFLLDREGRLRLIDLEEFRLGDPARDVGSMVGEWLHRATLDLVGEQDAVAAVADLELTHDEVVANGAAALDRRRPVIQRFFEAYRTSCGPDAAWVDDPAFVDRVTRFAGWHMFDRLIAVAEHTSRVSALHWAAAGIGRQALLAPRAAAPALGLPDHSDQRKAAA
ncbi:class V lanthionine synthetase subunit LxmK [Nocardioides zeae]|uniref:Class V lanthionine synthetase subunit LxmK n=1 Tax=Nocardioides imazamoxiresistens TaxID=3231893 RepID=A0ABU3PW75_9ACTN|nr:class V lanthionine synthetase subunit LxmK [Nocardioides zeae]MDT9593136.1 class V lanthionine synthetase subunit LxmK [Nocardioides zeae]